MISKSITVSSDVAPDVDFTSENVCAGHDVIFNALNDNDLIQILELLVQQLNGNLAQRHITITVTEAPAVEMDVAVMLIPAIESVKVVPAARAAS